MVFSMFYENLNSQDLKSYNYFCRDHWDKIQKMFLSGLKVIYRSGVLEFSLQYGSMFTMKPVHEICTKNVQVY